MIFMLLLVCTECLRFPHLGVDTVTEISSCCFFLTHFELTARVPLKSVICAGAAGKGGRDMGEYNYFFENL